MNILKILLTSIAAALSHNVIFSEYLGIEPFFEETKDREVAFRASVAIIVLTAATCLLTSLVDTFLLKTFSIEYMRTVVFVLIMIIVWRGAIALKSRIKLPMPYVLSSTAVLGTALSVSSNGMGPFGALLYGIFAGLGYMLSSFLFVELRARLEYSETPKFLKGLPILLITAGLIALVFTGFHGMEFVWRR